MKRIQLRHSLLLVFLIFSQIFGQSKADEQLNFMQNCLLLGLEEKGIEIGSEIISKKEYSSVKETAMFTIAEYFFTKGMLYNYRDTSSIWVAGFDIMNINKAYTFYNKLIREFPESEFKDVARKRIEYLEFNYETQLLFRDLSDHLQNERSIVEKKLSFANIFLNRSRIYKFLFFIEGDDPNTYEMVTKYYNDIIINNPVYSIYAYYQKLLIELSRSYKVEIISSIIEKRSLPISRRLTDDISIEENVVQILNILNKDYTHHPLTIKSYLVAVSYLSEAGIWDYDSKETKKWLELALKDDMDKLGFTHLLTKEYLLKTNFDEE